jgi:hypothetical protein
MACNPCETAFQGGQTLVVNVGKSGTNAVISLSNQGSNTVLISRVLLCASYAGGETVLFLRAPPNLISWIYPSAYLEPGIAAEYYLWSGLPAGSLVQAQAEYVEIEGRSRSCPETI